VYEEALSTTAALSRPCYDGKAYATQACGPTNCTGAAPHVSAFAAETCARRSGPYAVHCM